MQVRLVKPGTLLPLEVPKYDRRMVLEALHNAIAHQDYTRAGRVLVQEYVDRLVITNEGGFFEGRPDEYAMGGKSPTRYRNPLLAQTMVELGMIDTLGYGIFDMYNRQRHRFLPLPDYDLSKPNQVKLTIPGAVIDEAYTDLLMQRTDLPLADVIALDRIQKGLTIPDNATRRLRRAGLIQGRKPHLQVTPMATETPPDGLAQARFADDARLLQIVLDHLAVAGTATRRDIDKLLRDQFDGSLDDRQQARKVTYLLAKLRRDNLIRNTGSKTNSLWVLAAPPVPRDPL